MTLITERLLARVAGSVGMRWLNTPMPNRKGSYKMSQESLAVLVVGYNASTCYQTLIMPQESDTLLFHREYTGQRGRGSAWRTISLGELPNTDKVEAPFCFSVSTNNIAQAGIGLITPVSNKAMKLWDENSPVTALETTSDYLTVVKLMRDMLIEGSADLQSSVIDGSNVSLRPIGKARNPLGVSFQPEREPETTVVPIATHAPTSTDVIVAEVPDKKWANTYVNRKLPSGHTEFEIFDSALANAENVLIFGPTGSGKTMSALAYASTRNLDYYNISSHNGSEPSEWIGRWIPTPDGHYKWQDGAVTQIVRNGGVLLLNEVNFLPERVTTAIFSLLDDRRHLQLMGNNGEIVHAHPNLLIIADMNPNYRGTRPMNEAFKDRWAHKLEFDYDPTIERRLIKAKSLLEMAKALREGGERREIMTPISTRSLVTFSNNIHKLGLDYAIYSFLNGFGDMKERNAVRVIVENTYKANIAQDFGIEVNFVTDVAEQVAEAVQA